MSVYGALYRQVMMPIWENGVRRRPTLRHLHDLERTQWSTLEDLRALQSRALGRLLTHAYDHVPYYKALFDEAGFRARESCDPADLLQLPLLTREAARRAGDLRRSTAPPLATIHKTTGGSTGQPLAFGYDVDSESWRQAVRMRGYSWAGWQPGERTLHYWGRVATRADALHRLKIAVDRGLRGDHVVDCALRSESALAETADWIARKHPRVIVSYCHGAVDLARYITAHGTRNWESIPVLCCAEELLPSDREILVGAFGPAVFETYGCREFMLIAMECEAHEGLHLSMENLVVELLVKDGAGMRAARPGEAGEVVVTDLHNFGMPFIRYATGDLAVAAPETRCACGRAAPRLASVSGRVVDTLRGPNGSRVDGLLFSIIFTELAASVRQFQVVQAVDRSITLKLVADHAFTEADRLKIRLGCTKYLGDTPVRIEEVPEIAERANGKRRIVVVET